MWVHRTSECYNPTQDTWSTGPPLPDSVSFAAYSVLQVTPVVLANDAVWSQSNRDGSRMRNNLDSLVRQRLAASLQRWCFRDGLGALEMDLVS